MSTVENELRVLLLEDNPADAEIIQRVLRKENPNFIFHLSANKKNFLEALDKFSPEIILCDNSLPQFNSTAALEIVKNRRLNIPFILVTGTVSEEFAAEIIKLGANDYILKDRLARLPSAIRIAIDKKRAENERLLATERLIRSEERYRTLVERVSDGFIAMDASWNITYINKVAETMFGYTYEAIIGKNMWGLFPEAIDQSFYHAYKEAMATQKHIRVIDYSIIVKRWVEANIYPSISGISLYFRDISEQKIAELKNKENEERYRTLIERISDAFIALDRNFRYTYLNKQAGELIHRDPDTLIGKNVWEEFPDAVGSVTYYSFLKAMNDQQYQNNIDYYAPLDLWQENFIYPSADGLSIFIKDISERKRAEEELLQSQKRLTQAQEIAHLGNWQIDFADGRSKWSDEAYRIYGIVPGDHNLSIEDWMAFVHPEDLPRVSRILKESQVNLTDLAFHHRIVRKDGSIRHIYSQSKYEFDPEGRPSGLYGIAHDVTESKIAEQELVESTERFKLATRATSDIIWELNFSKKKFLMHEGKEQLLGLGHDLAWAEAIEGKYIVEGDIDRVRKSFTSARIDPNAEFWQDEYRAYDLQKKVIYVINHAIFIRDPIGKAIRAVGAITDISEKKKLEKDLLDQQRNEQLLVTATALEAQEKERTAIGQELHDNVNQIIASTILRLSIPAKNPEDLELAITEAKKNLQVVIGENRKIAHALVAPDFGAKQLVEQMRTLADAMLIPAGIEVDIDTGGLVEDFLRDQEKLAIYRIAQEQCTNIIKYSKARNVSIILQTTGVLFEMIISDDGVGMDPGKKTEGIGLRNIKGRLSVFDGVVKIESSPGNGFTLSIAIPIKRSK